MAQPEDVNQALPEGRRIDSRLRLHLPAKLILVGRTVPCVLQDISHSGARLVVEEVPAVGEFGQIQCTVLDRWFDTVWCAGHRVGIAFDEPIPFETLVFLRQYNDSFPQMQRSEIKARARSWVNGELD